MPVLDHAPADMLLFDDAHATAETPPLLRSLILARVACPKGATLTELVRDFSPLVSHRHSPAEWRACARGELARLIDAGLAQEHRARITATEAGATAVDHFFGRDGASKSGWAEVRDGRLIAMALGIAHPGPRRLKMLLRPDGLRAVILRQAFGLSNRVAPTPAKLRAALARVALERSFGDQVRGGLSDGNGFSASDGRLLAGQLARRPRAFQSDARLIAVLAAEAVQARQTDLESLRTAILRRLFTQALDEVEAGVRPPIAPAISEADLFLDDVDDAGMPLALADAPPSSRRSKEPVRLAAARVKPTLAAFADAVNAAAQVCAEGWPGNYKAYIANAFEVVALRHPEWDLCLVAFKCMLTEAHLSGHVELAGADLKSAEHREALAASEITYKNTVWHQIRVASSA